MNQHGSADDSAPPKPPAKQTGGFLRLRSSEEIKRVQRSRIRLRGQWITWCHLSPGLSEGRRMAVAVSKKIAKQAVKRNRMKRLLREAFRLRPDLFTVGDWVAVVQKDFSDRTLIDVIEDCAHLAGRVLAGRVHRMGKGSQ